MRLNFIPSNKRETTSFFKVSFCKKSDLLCSASHKGCYTDCSSNIQTAADVCQVHDYWRWTEPLWGIRRGEENVQNLNSHCFAYVSVTLFLLHIIRSLVFTDTDYWWAQLCLFPMREGSGPPLALLWLVGLNLLNFHRLCSWGEVSWCILLQIGSRNFRFQSNTAPVHSKKRMDTVMEANLFFCSTKYIW